MKWTIIVELLLKVWDAITNLKIKRENKKAQEERDAIEKDPVGWFNGHFGGVSGDKSDKTSSKTTTDKTDN